MVERRKEPRFRSLLGGQIGFGSRQRAMDCIVRNIAPEGALVVFPHTSLTPREFDLHIPSRDETYAAKVAWRLHDRAGVALSPKKVEESPAYTARCIRLAAETNRLRKQLDAGGW